MHASFALRDLVPSQIRHQPPKNEIDNEAYDEAAVISWGRCSCGTRAHWLAFSRFNGSCGAGHLFILLTISDLATTTTSPIVSSRTDALCPLIWTIVSVLTNKRLKRPLWLFSCQQSASFVMSETEQKDPGTGQAFPNNRSNMHDWVGGQ